jgi:hypothetical protein
MGREGYFGVSRDLHDVDIGVAGISAACCGVNLAFSRIWGLGLIWGGWVWV